MKRIYSLILVFAMLTAAGIIPAVYAEEETAREKRICTATIDELFTDDCVLVEIDDAYYEMDSVFTLEDFPGVDITEIKDISYIPDDKALVEKLGIKQTLRLTLKNPGKDEVLKQIKNLEKLDFVYAAIPDYYIIIDDGFIYSEDEDIGSEKGEGDNEYDEMPSDDTGDNDLWQIEETVSEELPNEEITNESDTGEKHLRDIAKKAPSEMTAQREKPERAAYNDSERDTCAPLIGTDEIFTAIGAVMILRFAAALIH